MGETKFVEIAVPSSNTCPPGTKSLPAKLIVVAGAPTVSAFGMTVATVGERFCTVNGNGLEMSTSVVTVTFPVVEVCGTTTFRLVVEPPVTAACTPLNKTVFFARIGSNAEPLMVTVCPHAPEPELIPVMTGTPTFN